jgi:hypothetical protein
MRAEREKERGEIVTAKAASFLPSVLSRARAIQSSKVGLRKSIRRASLETLATLLEPDVALSPQDRISVVTLGLRATGELIDRVEVKSTLAVEVRGFPTLRAPIVDATLPSVAQPHALPDTGSMARGSGEGDA